MAKQRDHFNLIPATFVGAGHQLVRTGAISTFLLGACLTLESSLTPEAGRAQAQEITPDATLGSQVNLGPLSNLNNPAGPDSGFVITGGTLSGNSLFHSFETFSPETLPTEFNLLDPAYAAVDRIFSRVSGSAPSHLNGFLQVVGGHQPELFVLNPNGILIGPDANISLPGSLFLSTAERLSFADGSTFAADTTAGPASPLLTLSAPVGIQFGASAAPIALNGQSSAPVNLDISPGRSLTLLGGDIDINHSFLNTVGGQIQLASVGAYSALGLNGETHGLSYTPETAFQDIRLTDATADVSGPSGHLSLQGRHVQIANSTLLANTLGADDGGNIDVTASEQLDVDSSAIFTDVIPLRTGPEPEDVTPSVGQGGDVTITTNRFNLASSFIFADTTSVGRGGDLTIRAQEVFLHGAETIAPDSLGFSSVLSASTFAEGQGGNLTIHTDNLVTQGLVAIVAATYGDAALNGGNGGNLLIVGDRLQFQGGTQVGTGTFSSGNSGDLTVRAASRLDIRGSVYGDIEGQFVNISSGIFSSAEPGSTGMGGHLLIETPQLMISQGGTIAVGSSGAGDAGNLTLHAAEISVADPVTGFDGETSGIVASVSASGTGNGGQLNIVSDRLHVHNGGQITASTDGAGNAGSIHIQSGVIDIEGSSADGLFNSAISSRSTTVFDAGSVTLVGDRITLRDQGSLSVSNLAGGNAGNVALNAGTVLLNQGSIQAEARSGSQGNIEIVAREVLLLRDRSTLTTNATETATGGNITIDAPLIIGLGNSDISANAIQGDGGNIRLITQGLIGLAFRDQLSDDNDITASSAFGVKGSVTIESPNVDPDSGLVVLPENLADASQQIVASCTSSQVDSQFVSSGRGGLPDTPWQVLSSHEPWQDFRAIDAIASQPAPEVMVSPAADSPAASQSGLPQRLEEASQWQLNAAGEVELLATNALAMPADNCLAQQMAP
jgi:filamentous hemagglutinin family protein